MINRVNWQKQNEIATLLKTVCQQVPGPNGKKYAKYDSGWDDDKVARSIPGVAKVNVAYIRTQLFGSTRIPKPPKPLPVQVTQQQLPLVGIGAEAVAIGQVALRVKRLEEQVHGLLEQVRALENYATDPNRITPFIKRNGNGHP